MAAQHLDGYIGTYPAGGVLTRVRKTEREDIEQYVLAGGRGVLILLPKRFLVLILALLSCTGLGQVQVPRWSTVEVSLTSSGSSSNWYTDANAGVTATFIGPGGVTKHVNGFWDGGSSFKLRFTPTKEGTWSYRTTSPNTGLNGKTGRFDCVRPTASQHGFLRVDASHPHSFASDDGTRYFMWGQTYHDVVISALTNDHSDDKFHSLARHQITLVNAA